MGLESLKLSKGMKFNLDKAGDKYHNLRVVLTWDKSAYGNATFDADLTIAVLENVGVRADGSPRRNIYAEDPNYLVYYNSPKVERNGGMVITTPLGEIVHTGDDRNGEDGEEAEIYLDKFSKDVAEIAIVGTIHKGEQRRQNWSALNAKLTLINLDNNEVLTEIDLGNKLPDMTAVQFASLYRDENGDWQFESVEVGHRGGLETFIEFWTS